MTKSDWELVGVGAAGLAAGALGGYFLSKSHSEVPTGLARLYSMPGTKSHDVEVSIVAKDGAYALAYRAPYGITDEGGVPSPDRASQLYAEFEDAEGFANQLDAAESSDDLMASFGYKAKGDWTETIKGELT